MKDNPIAVLTKRLAKLNITVEFTGNVPFIYLNKVNDNKITTKLDSDYGFTAFWYPIKTNREIKVNNITELFKEIRKHI